MSLLHSVVVLAAALACGVGDRMARADIYKWVNDEGAATFSNVPPKDRSRIVEIFPSSDWPQSGSPAAPAATRQEEELRILADRVDRMARLLEDERRYNPAQPVAYPQYAASAPPMWDDGWSPGWGYGWNGWWNGWYGPGYFASAPVVVVGTSHRFPHFNKFHHLPKSTHLGQGAIRSHPNAVIRTGAGARQSAGGGARFQGARGGRTR